jgi:hypothetical protein
MVSSFRVGTLERSLAGVSGQSQHGLAVVTASGAAQVVWCSATATKKLRPRYVDT